MEDQKDEFQSFIDEPGNPFVSSPPRPTQPAISVTRDTMSEEEPLLTRIEAIAIQEALAEYGETHSVFSEDFLSKLDAKIDQMSQR